MREVWCRRRRLHVGSVVGSSSLEVWLSQSGGRRGGAVVVHVGRLRVCQWICDVGREGRLRGLADGVVAVEQVLEFALEVVGSLRIPVQPLLKGSDPVAVRVTLLVVTCRCGISLAAQGLDELFLRVDVCLQSTAGKIALTRRSQLASLGPVCTPVVEVSQHLLKLLVGGGLSVEKCLRTLVRSVETLCNGRIGRLQLSVDVRCKGE